MDGMGGTAFLLRNEMVVFVRFKNSGTRCYPGWMITLPETNIFAPKNIPLKKEIPIGVSTIFGGENVSFRELHTRLNHFWTTSPWVGCNWTFQGNLGLKIIGLEFRRWLNPLREKKVLISIKTRTHQTHFLNQIWPPNRDLWSVTFPTFRIVGLTSKNLPRNQAFMADAHAGIPCDQSRDLSEGGSTCRNDAGRAGRWSIGPLVGLRVGCWGWPSHLKGRESS